MCHRKSLHKSFAFRGILDWLTVPPNLQVRWYSIEGHRLVRVGASLSQSRISQKRCKMSVDSVMIHVYASFLNQDCRKHWFDKKKRLISYFASSTDISSLCDRKACTALNHVISMSKLCLSTLFSILKTSWLTGWERFKEHAKSNRGRAETMILLR